MDKKVAVIMGSDSDLPVVKGAINSLKSYKIPVEVHKTKEKMANEVKEKDDKFQVEIWWKM